MKKILYTVLVILASCTNNEQNRFNLGEVAYQEGRYADARTIFTTAYSDENLRIKSLRYLHLIDSIQAISAPQNKQVPETNVAEHKVTKARITHVILLKQKLIFMETPILPWIQSSTKRIWYITPKAITKLNVSNWNCPMENRLSWVNLTPSHVMRYGTPIDI